MKVPKLNKCCSILAASVAALLLAVGVPAMNMRAAAAVSTVGAFTIETDGVDANITLAGVNIDVSATDSTAAFSIAENSTGNVTLTLADGTTNKLSSGKFRAGLYKGGAYSATLGTLTINGDTLGTGELIAEGQWNGAGIGGSTNGEEIVPTITGTPVDVGAYTFAINVIGDDTYMQTDVDDVSRAYTIVPKDIGDSDVIITLDPTEFVYDGKEKVPTVTVEYGNIQLVQGTDYTAVYTDNINAGTAAVTVTGKGNYTGTASENFTINKAQAPDIADITRQYQYAKSYSGEQIDLASYLVQYNLAEAVYKVDGTVVSDGVYTYDIAAAAAVGIESTHAVTVANRNYNDITFDIIIERVECTHESKTHTAAVAPTCTTDGSIEYWTCDYCKNKYSDEACTTIADNIVVPKTGHDYTAAWSWDITDESALATADFVCANDSTHTSSVEAEVTSAVIIPATCTDTGLVEYTAVAAFEGEQYTDKNQAEIPANGHAHNDEWNMDETCHWHVCDVCAEKCDIADHTEGDWIVDVPATTTEKGSKHKECTVCGFITETAEIPEKSGGGGGGSGGYDLKPAPELREPFIVDTEIKGWDDITAAITTYSNYSVITINLNGRVYIPQRVFAAAKTKFITLRFMVDGTYTWVIDCSAVSKADADFNAEISRASVTEADMDIPALDNKIAYKAFDLKASEYSYSPELEVAVGRASVGKLAKLYELNDEGRLVLIRIVKCDENGTVVISAAHKGKYVLAVTDEELLLGDIDGNLRVDALDASALLREIKLGTGSTVSDIADFNCDGKVDEVDVTAILEMIVGLT